MAEFVALNLAKTKETKSIEIGNYSPHLPTPVVRPAVAHTKTQTVDEVKRVRSQEATAQKNVMLFSRFVDFIKILSAPEVCFLMIVISKTNYGADAEVPIPRSDIIKNQAIPSLAIKQIREKLAAMGLIAVTQKRIGRGSEAWLYTLCTHKLNAMLCGKEIRGA